MTKTTDLAPARKPRARRMARGADDLNADAPQHAEPASAGAAIADALGSADQGAPPAPAPVTKAATVLALLRRPEGATLAELVAATGWLPHSARAHLTGLRNKGHGVTRAQRHDGTCYHLTESGQ